MSSLNGLGREIKVWKAQFERDGDYLVHQSSTSTIPERLFYILFSKSVQEKDSKLKCV